MAKVGLQLYTVKEDAERDLLGTIDLVGRMGYDGVEFAGVPKVPALQVKQTLANSTLAVAGMVVPMHQLQDEKAFEEAIGYCLELGCKTVLFPWLDDRFRENENTYKEVAVLFNGFGSRLRDWGIAFLYHVHGYEFATFGSRTGLEILMDETDPRFVGLEPDTYWIERGGGDALTVYRRYADRALSIHFKDMNNRTEMKDIEVGDGIIDTAGILRAAKGQPAQWFIVEQEQFDMTPLDSAAISCRNLKRLVEENYRS